MNKSYYYWLNPVCFGDFIEATIVANSRRKIINFVIDQSAGMNIKILISLVFVFSFLFAGAQSDEPVRIEINTQPETDVYKVIPCGEKGVLVFYQSVDRFDELHTTWVFTLFNTRLEQVWTREVPVLSDARYVEYAGYGEQLYLLFYIDGNIKKGALNVQLLAFNNTSEQFMSMYGTVEEKSEFIDMEAWNEKVFLGFNKRKYEIGFYMADFTSSAFSHIDLSLDERNLVEDIYLDKPNKRIAIIVNHFISKKQSYLLLKYFNDEGNLLQSIAVRAEDPDISLNAAKLIVLSADKALLIGSYNNEAAHSSGLKEAETISAGIFSSLIVNGEPGRINLYNFIDFRNFSSYMQVPRLIKYKRKEKNNPEKEFSLNYRLLPHDIVKKDSQYVFLTEAYYPEYRTVSYISYDYYGRPYPQTYTVFDGYKYFGGIVTAFDQSGKLLWENGIKIWNIQSFRLEKKVEAFFDNSDLVLAYVSEGRLASEIYSSGNTVGDFEYTDLQTKYRRDRIIDEQGSNIEKWYGKYFLVYGYQEIKNNALAEQNKRNVFYMNKIAFE